MESNESKLHSNYQTQARPKKRHTGLIVALIVTGLILIGATIAGVIYKDILVNKFMLATKSDQEYFEWASRRNVDLACKKLDLAEAAGMLKAAATDQNRYDNGFRADTHAHADLAEEFTDMLNLYPMKVMDLDLSVAKKGEETSFSARPYYNGKDLLTVNGMIDVDKNLLKAEIPDYKEGIVDLKSLYELEISEGKTVKEYLDKISTAIESVAAGLISSGKTGKTELLRQCSEAFITSVSEAELLKKSYVAVGEESVKCTEIHARLSNEDLKKMLKTMSSVLCDGNDRDIQTLIGLISDDVTGEVVLYVDDRADLVAFDLGGEYRSSKAALEVRFENNAPGQMTVKTGALLNDLKLLDIAADVRYGIDSIKVDASVTPEALVNAFLGSYSGLELKTGFEKTGDDLKINAQILKKTAVLADVSFTSSITAFTSPLLIEEGKTVYDISKWQDLDYFSLNDMVGFALSIYDRIGEEVLGNVINDQLHRLFGDNVDLENIRNWYDFGIFNWFSNADEARKALSGEMLEFNRYGYPTKVTEYIWNDPDPSEKYYYSYADLAGYASLSTYRGLKFIIAAPEELTPEVLEAAKEDFLKLYAGRFKVDQHTTSVEWGDEVYIDIVPYLYGFPVKAYSFENSYARIGEELYGEGLDEKLLGMKVGEARRITTTLQGDQYGEFQGMEVEFEVTLVTIDRPLVPTFTESFICGKLGFESVEACEEMIKSELAPDNTPSEEEILEKIGREAKSLTEYDELPRLTYFKLWNRYYAEQRRTMKSATGLSPEEDCIAKGKTVEELYHRMDDELERINQEHCFYAAIAQAEDIYVSGEELIEAVDLRMKESGLSSTSELSGRLTLEEITDSLIEEKIDRIMLDSVEIIRE